MMLLLKSSYPEKLSIIFTGFKKRYLMNFAM
ncbi:hypothetical protein PSTT_05652 [Puccinia striiformis]|uniref:Uncharacterized protein n=1 Tax=Puccinia striiformis TaxID=27350 RepID=A0A2S4VNG1_9BASI|nr:hypothetical protein PSTT_05652 [Puccinia striiformis]